MEADSDDDGFYAPVASADGQGWTTSNDEVKMEDAEDGEEEGEEVEGDDDDSDDINFITDAKALPKPELTSQPKRPSAITQPSQEVRKASNTPTPGIRDGNTPEPRRSVQPSSNDRPGTDYPGRHSSNIDPNGNPIHPTTGKPILSTDFDLDFPSESTKPWRKPGSDITDYFNYGFDEFTWASYCLKQQQMPKEIKEINAQAEQMKAFVEGIPGGGMPGMPNAPTGPAAANAMPGMPSEAEMQQMFQTMMSQGMDPSSMDPSQFMQMMMGSGPGGQSFSGQAQGFGGGSGQPPQQPQMGFSAGGGGFDQGNNFGGRGRGRGGRRNWG